MKRIFFYSSIFLMVTLLSGCRVQENISNTSTDLKLIDNLPKSGDTTIVGKLDDRGGTFVLVEKAGIETDVDSYKFNMADYAGKNVIVTGQYSGDTLFAGEVIVND